MKSFDYIVIGGGSGGIASANRAGMHGAKVLLIEGNHIGGTCVNVGCVPKKVMWSASEMRTMILKQGKEYGFDFELEAFDFQRLFDNRETYIERLHGLYMKGLASNGVTVVNGYGKFITENMVEVNGESYTAPHILIATGGEIVRPTIPGAEYGIDSNGFFKLREVPETVAVVGASRRFLAQARTHHVGIDFVSASLQYSDYSEDAQFVVPYELIELGSSYEQAYLDFCATAMKQYKAFVDAGISNDTAGYMAPQGLRNILIIQGNHDAWLNFIRLRACHRNTKETQYVTLRIWEALLKTADGEEMFAWAGPDCLYGKCREGKMSCGNPFISNNPTTLIKTYYPLLARGNGQ